MGATVVNEPEIRCEAERARRQAVELLPRRDRLGRFDFSVPRMAGGRRPSSGRHVARRRWRGVLHALLSISNAERVNDWTGLPEGGPVWLVRHMLRVQE